VREESGLVAFLPSEDLDRSIGFFTDVLGLRLVDRSDFAVAYRVGGVTLRITKVGDLRPQPFTILGWQVADLRVRIDELRLKGVAFLRYDGLEQDEQGIWTTPTGDLVAWFHDPDGNVLSLTELASD
jgi:catechol 2,3-dioxygenase-like lactoylglutathione lyase family enzyme